ncbi:uncharacterized protein FOMMEDRAFT_98785 [Fomitiporia mediterranea MF3/22]|uniref:Cupin type-2 domain-containing protein n=1 Tax=Fomitiporia mediterranea (strain MF3/22) TaxID=694068 RepID=R7SGX1_FOMME|nr:uncharacterized protein FOMMEDRAFT_98785 [Fomitiporia mediterranea MF3/22]EJC97547.1 hypothetical protein FOMMEDRAFT_98785 [Fomitiporia mediterranea MF3/22]
MASTNSFERPDYTPVRRVITGHSPEGKSVIVDDSTVESYPFRGRGPSLFGDLYWTDDAKPTNEVEFKDLIKAHREDLFGADGNCLRVVDIPPGQKSPYHRTISLDYGIMTHGTLTLILDDDKRVTFNPGDVFIQRGTIHSWLNEGKDWVRFYCVCIPSQKVKIGDKELEPEFRV